MYDKEKVWNNKDKEEKKNNNKVSLKKINVSIMIFFEKK